ncbi:GGDEF domain-containing protein [Sphingomonas morindae]|uniref:diguanylate cyclase n=1 Tax=Sphingomonas morindae TaxID=1541170 RepID=A0ABY4X8E6_9SPHN|nr:GGDEF domain-containing protein [Sphingomonas morindae]USI72920.1 GGDEF domain-containing protein [Sphingomonas morindae]
MSDDSSLFAKIGALLSEAGLEPTPHNYEFFYRYATGADKQLIAAVDTVRAAGQPLNNRIVGTIRRELFGAGGGLGRVIENAERELGRMVDYVEQSDADTREYRDRLDRSAVDHATTLDRQKAVLADMVEATNAILSQTDKLQSELARSAREIDALKADLEIARTESRSDPLTGLANRKACCDYLGAQLPRAARDQKQLSLIFLDIDHFKRVNDRFGHRTGDEVLRLVGQTLERSFHGVGFAARWGGEEFVVVMPGASAPQAAAYADRFRETIGARAVKVRGTGEEIGRVTLSMGISELVKNDTIQSLVDRADQALYEAKEGGRDRVICSRAAA